MNIIDFKQLATTLSLCAKYYKPDTFQHCLRVASFAISNKCVEDEGRNVVFQVAMCHDLLEDTNVTIDEICEATGSSKDFIKNVLGALTKEKSESYGVCQLL